MITLKEIVFTISHRSSSKWNQVDLLLATSDQFLKELKPNQYFIINLNRSPRRFALFRRRPHHNQLEIARFN